MNACLVGGTIIRAAIDFYTPTKTVYERYIATEDQPPTVDAE